MSARDPTADDLWLFSEGRQSRAYRFLGAHPAGARSWRFRVWAPDACDVDVVGDFNGWRGGAHRMFPMGTSGVWTCDVREARAGQAYKFRVYAKSGAVLDKADPFGQVQDPSPGFASRLFVSAHRWRDAGWRARRRRSDPWHEGVSIYEVHLGSWGRSSGDEPLFRSIAEPLATYAADLGFTHVELLPVMEHPFYGSWGYQVTGYFAPTSRYGSPDDFRVLIDTLHRHGVGVILDWVPAHFPDDPHGLARFDGTALFEHADPRLGWHPDWKTHIFNFGRNEVRSFLLSSADYWLSELHVDGLRVDAVASMLYLDYSRAPGAWIPNAHGGNENLEAVSFLQLLNERVHTDHPQPLMIAEESTAWPGVTRPTSAAGLGFGFKWDMGWMHDTLKHFARDPIHRRYHLDDLTFRSVYAHAENFIVALSHDEVVHGKGSLPGRMPGDTWQRYANVRLLLAYMYAQPGKKLLFMGMEFAQWEEWSHERGLSWAQLADPLHAGVQALVRDLNRLLQRCPALHRADEDPSQWCCAADTEASVITIVRRAPGARPVIAVFNLTPSPRAHHAVDALGHRTWREVLNTDDYAGGGPHPRTRRRHRADQAGALGLDLPALGAVFLTTWGDGA